MNNTTIKAVDCTHSTLYNVTGISCLYQQTISVLHSNLREAVREVVGSISTIVSVAGGSISLIVAGLRLGSVDRKLKIVGAQSMLVGVAI